MKEPRFGDKIVIHKKLKRKVVRERDENDIHQYKVMKQWQEERLEEVKEVIYLGNRTLSNGRRYYEDYGYSYRPTEHFQAMLVCEGPNKNPYYAPL